MPMTPDQARDEAFTLFSDAWNAATVIAPMPEIRYQGKEKGDLPSTYFVRLSMVNAKTVQSSFAEDEGPSKAKFENYGTITVQVFAPMQSADAFNFGDLLAIKARDIFRRVETPSGMWFRNARKVELPNDGERYRWNVVIEYQFTETSA